MTDYFLTARRVRKGEFVPEPGKTRFLKIPSNRVPAPSHAIPRKDWLGAVLRDGHTHTDAHTGEDCGDITVFVHGYNTSPSAVAKRHRALKKAMASKGYRGALLSFDWPSDDRALNYLEDRVDAKMTALQMVSDGLSLLAATQQTGCRLNLHVVAHSMGCYVVREAFDDADDRPSIAAQNWTVSQLCFVAADVSRRSLSRHDARSSSLFRHCNRMTNYFSPYDNVLTLANIKRVGVAPRAGRHGLPHDRPDNSFDVDCGDRFTASKQRDSHSWYFSDNHFIADLAATLTGKTAANVNARRRIDSQGNLHLS